MKLCDVCSGTTAVTTCIITESMQDHSRTDPRERSPKITDIDLCQACINKMREQRNEARSAADHIRDFYEDP